MSLSLICIYIYICEYTPYYLLPIAYCLFFCLRQRKIVAPKKRDLGQLGTNCVQVGEMSKVCVVIAPLTTVDDCWLQKMILLLAILSGMH